MPATCSHRATAGSAATGWAAPSAWPSASTRFKAMGRDMERRPRIMSKLGRKAGRTAIAVAMVAGTVVSIGADQAPPVSVPGLDRPVIVVTNEVTGTENWSANFYYVLRGAVFVRAGATLNI